MLLLFLFFLLVWDSSSVHSNIDVLWLLLGVGGVDSNGNLVLGFFSGSVLSWGFLNWSLLNWSLLLGLLDWSLLDWRLFDWSLLLDLFNWSLLNWGLLNWSLLSLSLLLGLLLSDLLRDVHLGRSRHAVLSSLLGGVVLRDTLELLDQISNTHG